MNEDYLFLGLNFCQNYARVTSPFFCKNFHEVIKNIYPVCQEADRCIFVNNQGRMPYRYIKYPDDISGMHYEDYIGHIKNIEVLKKNRFSALSNDHVLSVVRHYDNIVLGGFLTAVDIFCTAMELIEQEKNVYCSKELTGDLCEPLIDDTLGIMYWIGVNKWPT